MRQPHEFDLQWEGRRCVVHDLGSMQARQVARRVANVIGTAIRESGAAAIDKDLQAAAVVASGSVLERLDDETIEWLTQTFTKVTQVESAAGTETWLSPKDVSEFVFGGGEGLARWMRWMAFCLEITCADFFRAAFSELVRIQGKAKASGSSASPTNSPKNGVSPSPTTSPTPGTSTAS